MRIVLSTCSLLALVSCTGILVPPSTEIGVQLYTVRSQMQGDAVATLRHVAALGFDEVEFAGTHGAAPAELCAETRRLGLGVAASHVDWQLLRSDPRAAIAETRALCADTMVLAWLPPEERRTRGQWERWIERLNQANELARAEGVTLAYHAHDFEFARVDGIRPIDLLMAGLDPQIGFELDTYWIAKAGLDPLRFLRDHGDRVTHLHLKDMAADGSMADVGEGVLDMQAIVAQAQSQGVAHFLVERDDASDPWASLATSLDSLRAMPLQRRAPSMPSGATRP